MASKVVLLYGSGPNVGAAVLKKFASEGWKTAAVVRTMKDEYKGTADMVLQADFADAKAVQSIYSEVESKLGTPNCVAWNAYSYETFNPDLTTPFAASPEVYAKDLSINTTSVYAAAQIATAGFAKIGNGPKSFIYTGNPFATSIVPEQTGLASGKAATAYLIELASVALKDSQWYYADERLANGRSVMMRIDARLHGVVFYTLATSGKQEPWNYTFVKDKGYVKFPDIHDREWTPIADLLAGVQGESEKYLVKSGE